MSLISIITPTYNSLPYIKAVYLCLVNQSHNNWEWLVTDDCSNDGTYEWLSSIDDQRVKVQRNDTNSGAAVTRNNSIKRSSGNFLAFIDSDDIWNSKKLESQLKFMNDNDINFSFTPFELIDEHCSLLGNVVDTKLVGHVGYEDMLRKKATLGCSTVMLRRSAFDDISMPLIRTGQDYGLWLKLLKTGMKAYPMPEVLTQYRILPNSISRNKVKKAKRQWQIYREIEKLSLLKSAECFCFYAWRAVFRK